MRVYFGRCSRKGLFSCADGKAAAGNGFRIGFIHVWHDLLKGCCIEPVGDNGSPADDVLPSGQLFRVAFQHFSLDCVPEGFGLSFGFFNDGLPFVQGFNLGYQFVSARCSSLLLIY